MNLFLRHFDRERLLKTVKRSDIVLNASKDRIIEELSSFQPNRKLEVEVGEVRKQMEEMEFLGENFYIKLEYYQNRGMSPARPIIQCSLWSLAVSIEDEEKKQEFLETYL